MPDRSERRHYPLTIDRVVRSVREGTYTTLPPEAVAVALAVMAVSAPRTLPRCNTWTDHAFTERQVAHGRDAVRGRFDRYVLRCGGCGLEMTETRWVDLPPVPLPQGAEGGGQ